MRKRIAALFAPDSSAHAAALMLAIAWLALGAVDRPVVNVFLDVGRWLHEAERVSAGALQYRDVTWPYPPLSLYALATWFRVFGARVESAIAFNVVVSVLTTSCIWAVARNMGVARVGATGIALAASLASWYSVQVELYSINVYTPAVLVGSACGLVFLASASVHLRAASLRARIVSAAASGLGVAGCFLTKPEFALAATLSAPCFFASIASARPRRGDVPVFALCATVPVVLGYGVVLRAVGLSHLLEGLTGYGIALEQAAETARGLPLVLRDYAQAAALSVGPAALIDLVVGAGMSRGRPSSLVARRVGALLLGVASAAHAIRIGVLRTEPWSLFRWLLDGFFVGSFIALPLLFLVLSGALFARWRARRRGVPPDGVIPWLTALFCLVASGRLYSRGVQAIYGFPFFLPVLGSLACVSWFLGARSSPADPTTDDDARSARARRFALVTLGAALGSAALHATPGLADGFTRLPIVKLATPRGNIALSAREAGPMGELLAYVEQNTSGSDPLLSLPYGAWLNFFASRPSPTPQAQFWQYRFSDELQRELDSSLARNPPAMVIVLKVRRPWWPKVVSGAERDSPSVWSSVRSGYDLADTVARGSFLEFEALRPRASSHM